MPMEVMAKDGSSEATKQIEGKGKQDQHRGGKWLEEMRGWLMLLASVLASMTYQAGINPPHFKEDENNQCDPNKSGCETNQPRYYHYLDPDLEEPFFWFNSLAFAYSLSMVMLLLSESISYSQRGLLMLRALLIVNILIVSVAYDLGSARNLARALVPATLLFGALITSVFNIWHANKILNLMPACSKCLRHDGEP